MVSTSHTPTFLDYKSLIAPHAAQQEIVVLFAEYRRLGD